ncbi:hypothetical protein [Liquorilactobacillus hordei]|uniref:hypothetical protein n=1 Tax=Liquorilactobacillus hordei TaxID=468911 RepID=UPI0015E7FB47|nr:hypothetical protein [Liquorilactobacillus hordei]
MNKLEKPVMQIPINNTNKFVHTLPALNLKLAKDMRMVIPPVMKKRRYTWLRGRKISIKNKLINNMRTLEFRYHEILPKKVRK